MIDVFSGSVTRRSGGSHEDGRIKSCNGDGAQCAEVILFASISSDFNLLERLKGYVSPTRVDMNFKTQILKTKTGLNVEGWEKLEGIYAF